MAKTKTKDKEEDEGEEGSRKPHRGSTSISTSLDKEKNENSILSSQEGSTFRNQVSKKLNKALVMAPPLASPP
jgi:hypothetical protein